MAIKVSGTTVIDDTRALSNISNLTSLSVGTATNIAGGAAGNVSYQSGAGATAFVTNGTAGQVLTSNGASAPTWQNQTVLPTVSTTFTSLQTFNLIELVKTQETYQTLTATATQAIDFNSGALIYLNQGVNITSFSYTNIPVSTKGFSWTILRKNTAGSALSITWGSSIKWSNAVAPTLTNTLNGIDIFTFITFDGGTTIYGITSGTNFS